MAKKVTAIKSKAKKVVEEELEEKPETEDEDESAEDEEKPAPKSRLKKWKPTSVIRLLVEKNPKRAGSGSYKRYEKYNDGMTVQEALEEGITPADLDYDNKKEFIKIVA